MKRSAMVRAPKGHWICRRQSGGQKCLHTNPNRKQLCLKCGKAKPKKSKPKHMVVLTQMSYEDFIAITGEERCEICGAPPKTKRLQRDHDHRTGKARGLLCFRDNAAIRDYMTLEWARALVAYLERHESRCAEREISY